MKRREQPSGNRERRNPEQVEITFEAPHVRSHLLVVCMNGWVTSCVLAHAVVVPSIRDSPF